VPITVLFDEQLIAQWLATGTAPDALTEAGESVVSQGFALQPVHPGATDPALAAAFVVTVPDEDTANRLLTTLRSNPAVAGAYIKPPESLPSPGA